MTVITNAQITPEDFKKDNEPKESRNVTDFPFVFLFGIIFGTWFFLCLYAIAAGPNGYENVIAISVFYKNGTNVTSFYLRVNELNEYLSDKTLYYYNSSPFWRIFCVLIGAPVIYGFLVLLRKKPFFTAVAALVFLCCDLAKTLWHFTTNLTDIFVYGADLYSVFASFWNLETALFLIVVVFSIRLAGLNNIAEIIKQSLCALFYSGYIVLLGTVMIFAYALIGYFTITALGYIDLFKPLHVIIILGAIYVFNFVYFFVKMSVAEAVDIWHRTEVKEDVPRSTVFECANTVYRYHLGTVAYAATIILPMCTATYVACKSKCATSWSESFFIRMIFKCYLIIDMSEYAVIQTAMHGHNFLESTKMTFQLMLRNSSLTLGAVTLVNKLITYIELVTFFFILIVPVIVMSTSSESDEYEAFINSLTVLIVISLILLLPVFALVEAALHTTLFYNFEKIVEEEKRFQQNNLAVI